MKVQNAKLRDSFNKRSSDKGAGRMPRHQEPKKDVISCEKLGGAANGQ